jgi:hypothetical protein
MTRPPDAAAAAASAEEQICGVAGACAAMWRGRKVAGDERGEQPARSLARAASTSRCTSPTRRFAGILALSRGRRGGAVDLTGDALFALIVPRLAAEGPLPLFFLVERVLMIAGVVIANGLYSIAVLLMTLALRGARPDGPAWWLGLRPSWRRSFYDVETPEYDLFPELLGVGEVTVKVGFEWWPANRVIAC